MSLLERRIVSLVGLNNFRLFFLQSHSSRCCSLCLVIARPVLCGLLTLSLEHVQLPRYLRLAPLSLPRLFVYFFTINYLYFYTFNVDIHIFGLYCILYSHCVKAAAGLPNLVRQKNNVISVIQAAPLFLVWLATLHDQPQ